MGNTELQPHMNPEGARPGDASVLDCASTELSARRTGMSFQRTRMSADRTMMSIIRTSLSLISFGFTIAQGFLKLHESGVIKSAAASSNFGSALVMIGILLLAGGIGYHVLYMSQLRQERKYLAEQQLIHAQTVFPYSLSLMTAVVLLVLGTMAMLGVTFGVGPLG